MSNVPAVPVSGPRLRAGQGAPRMSRRSAMDSSYATAKAWFFPVCSGRAGSVAWEVDVYIATLLCAPCLTRLSPLGQEPVAHLAGSP